MSKKNPSRSERLDEVMGKIGDAKAELETLRDEMQNWLDSMPENLQESEKAGKIQEAIENLESMISSLDEAEGTSVEFPGMFG
jgi:chromosome segregation ATPase